MNLNKIKKTEALIMSLLTTLLFSLLYLYYKATMPYTYGDSAFLIESVVNLSDSGITTSRLLAQNAATQKLGFGALDIYCRKGLQATQFAPDPYNWLTSLHAYLILYLIVPFARVIGALNALSVFTALTFSSIPLVAYVYLRKIGSSIAASTLAAAICIIHPAWQISSVGQFYVDRFFIPLAMLYVISLYQYFKFELKFDSQPKTLIIWVILLGLLGGFTSERNMLTVVIFSLGYACIAQASYRKKFIIIGFSFICLLYLYIYIRFFHGTADNARVESGIFNIQAWVQALKIPGLSEYLLFNMALLVLPAIITPRLFLAVLPIVAINCIVTIGGAEKNGWATHYHSHYFGFIVASFLVAIGEVNDKTRNRAEIFFQKFLVFFLASITMSLTLSYKHYYDNQSVFRALWDYHAKAKKESNTRAQIEIFEKLVKNVPVGASVTATEWAMAAWYLRGNTATIFPIGIGLSDYIMVQAEGGGQNIKLLSAVRYGAADTIMANACHLPTILEDYKEVSRVGTWVLLKKNG